MRRLLRIRWLVYVNATLSGQIITFTISGLNGAAKNETVTRKKVIKVETTTRFVWIRKPCNRRKNETDCM